MNLFLLGHCRSVSGIGINTMQPSVIDTVKSSKEEFGKVIKFWNTGFINSCQRGKFYQHLPHNLWGSDVARIFLFHFSKTCNMFLRKTQQSYCYTRLYDYWEEFVLKPISNILNILVCCNLSLTRSLNVCYFLMNG